MKHVIFKINCIVLVHPTISPIDNFIFNIYLYLYIYNIIYIFFLSSSNLQKGWRPLVHANPYHILLEERGSDLFLFSVHLFCFVYFASFSMW